MRLTLQSVGWVEPKAKPIIAATAAMGFAALNPSYDCYGTEEAKEGGRAFREKRTPDFRKHKK